MDMRQTLLAGATVMLLATSAAWGGIGNGTCAAPPCGNAYGKAPEIDAATATIPIALLTGIVLLMKERKRSKRPSKSDE
jgi:hypothetical protein